MARARSGAAAERRLVLVTVGTTKFDALIEAADGSAFLDALERARYTHLIVQHGRGKYCFRGADEARRRKAGGIEVTCVGLGTCSASQGVSDGAPKAHPVPPSPAHPALQASAPRCERRRGARLWTRLPFTLCTAGDTRRRAHMRSSSQGRRIC